MKKTEPTHARVLVVDDDAMVRASHCRLLQRDYDVVSAPDAVFALARIASGEHFDAVVCDVMMDGINGPEFHRHVGAIDVDLQSCIVFVTGGASPDVADALALLTNRVLLKPVLASLLRDAVRDVIAAATRA